MKTRISSLFRRMHTFADNLQQLPGGLFRVLAIMVFAILFTYSKLLAADINHHEKLQSTILSSPAIQPRSQQTQISDLVYRHFSLSKSKAIFNLPVSHKRSILEVSSTICGVWMYDNYLVGEPWAKIGTKSIQENFYHGFEWDHGAFDMNQFAHPYNGNIYFTAARSNGFSFYESFPYTIGGSLVWELFMENHYPSINDMIMTTLGGIALGEVMFRLSNSVIDESSFGLERITRETVATIISPMNGLNRFLDGKMSRWSPNTSRDFPIDFTLCAGGNGKWCEEYNSKMKAHNYLGLLLNYNDSFLGKELRTPFDHFKLNVEFNLFEDSEISTVNIMGMVVGRELEKGSSTFVCGIYQHYDYIDNDSVMLSSVSIGPGLNLCSSGKNQKYFKLALHLQGIALGASNTDYNPKMMEYNFGSGFSGFTEIELGKKDLFSTGFSSKYYWMKNIKGKSGVEKVWTGSVVARFPLLKAFHYNLEYAYYNRTGVYDELPETSQYTDILRTFLTFEL